MQSAPHSAEQFGPQRDFWWHRDFLDLMATRWRLRDAGSLADIGCGRGHWSRCLFPYLRSPARLIGVDREPQWVGAAREEFARAFPQAALDQFNFLVGDATRIPLPDDSCEVATCQTLLMHLPDPRAALREMLRILRPGGLLICVEPNNLWNFVPCTSRTADEPVEVLVRRFEFWLRYQRGRVVLGEGDHAIGDLLPGQFAELGLREIEVFQSDRAAALFPPYATPAQRALIEQERQWMAEGNGPWDREELRRCVLAGGGTEEFFSAEFAHLRESFARDQLAIDAGNFSASGGSLFYLVSGRKE